MATTYDVALSKVIKELSLNVISMPGDPDKILISSTDVNRPGLELNGFYDYYDSKRIMIFGNAETAFLNSIDRKSEPGFWTKFSQKSPRRQSSRATSNRLRSCWKRRRNNGVPLLNTPETTSSLVARLVSFMNVEMAPRITRHGVLVEVYGEGILLVGDSGVGKSETAIELIKRGHRLIADDAVVIKRVSAISLVGEAPDNIKHFIELRGIGIINARRIFGMGAVKVTEKIDMVINLEIWDNQKTYDRMGIDNEYTEILGIKVPVLTIPVKPGRNLAVIIEVAAMNNRQKKMGYNAAQDLLKNLGMDLDSMPANRNGETNLNF